VCPTGGRLCCEPMVGRFYPREEPDALMSARPGLCGGTRKLVSLPRSTAKILVLCFLSGRLCPQSIRRRS
jgi:hypothetical protein